MSKPTSTKQKAQLFIVNLFGALFYIGCLLQWLWACIPYLPPLINLLDTVQRPDTPVAAPEVTNQAASLPPTLLVIIGTIILILAVVATVYALITIPKSIAKAGHTVTQATSKKIATATPKYKELPAKKQLQLTARVVFYVKIALVALPVAIAALSFTMPVLLPYDVTLLVTAGIGFGNLILLTIQAVLGRLLKVSLAKTW